MPRSSFPAQTTDETLEVFQKPAGWMLYWGSTLLVLFVVLLLVLAAFVKYPDQVEIPVTITTVPPPVPVVARSAGMVQEIWIREGEQVKKDDVLAVFSSSAQLADIRYLDSLLRQLQTFESALALADLRLREPLRLSELGAFYTPLLNTTAEIKATLSGQAAAEQVRLLNAQIEEQQLLQDNLKGQEETLRLELAIAERNLDQFKTLFERESASQIEVDQSAIRFLDAQRQLEEQQNRISNTRSRKAQLEAAKKQLQTETDETNLSMWLEWKAQLRGLQQALYQWEEKYLLKASADGNVTFFEPLSEGQYVEALQAPLGIVPDNREVEYQVEGRLPDNASGEIRVDAEGYLEVFSYPSQRYGELRAVVESIAAAPRAIEEGYRIQFRLPDGLQTTHGHQLEFRQQMTAQATILTNERSLLGRLFDRLRNLSDSQ